MSWQVHGSGRYYHSYSDYQAALRAYEENSAGRQLERRAAEIRNRLDGLRGELRDAAGQLAREQNLQRQFAGEVRELERTAERMDRAHREELTRMDRDIEHLANTLDQTKQDIDGVRQQFNEDRRKFTEKHANLQRDIRSDLDRLGDEKTAADQRLDAARHEAAEQFVKQRRERLERESDQAKRAALALDLAAQALTAARAQAAQAGHSELARRAVAIEQRIQSARELSLADAAAALAAATAAQTDTQLIEEQAAEAHGRMAADRERAARLVTRVRELIADARVGEFFPRQRGIVSAEMETAVGRMEDVFSNYERYLAEYPVHAAALEKAEQAAEKLNADAPVAKQRCEERKVKARETIRQIEEKYGKGTATARPLDPGDPLAPVEVMVKLDDETLRLTFHLDRDMEMCAYRHASDYDCKKSMARAMSLLSGIMEFKKPVHDHEALSKAPPPQAAVPEPPRTVPDVGGQRRVG